MASASPTSCARKQVTPKELLDEAVARTARVDPQLNAVVVKHYDYAEKQIEQGLPDGPFTGVPFLLKDLEYLGGTRTTFGATIFKDLVADHNGTFAQRCLDAGLTIFGKSASPEMGLLPTTEPRLHGPTRNPWNLAHSSGGSSGGASAAVAARVLPVAHASDGGGSIRIPASACGVFGMKPTRARMPLGPDRGEGWGGFSCNHVVSISVRDSAVMMDALGGPEPTSIYHAPAPERPYADEVRRAPGRLRIAFTDKHTYEDGTLDPEVAQAVRDAASMLEKLGHHVEERAPKIPSNGPDAMALIVGANVAQPVTNGRAAAWSPCERCGVRRVDHCDGAQCAEEHVDRLRRRADRGVPDFACAVRISRQLRRFPVADALQAAAPPRRAQFDVERFLADSGDPAQLHPGHGDVQHVRPARDVGAAGLEQERIADRHDVRRTLRRRGNAVSPGGTARAGTPMEGQTAAGLR